MKPPRGLLVAAALGALLARSAAAADRTYAAAAAGWQFERFGDAVAILRLGLVAAPSRPPGLLILSCENDERRWRLVLPDLVAPVAGQAAATGTMLARALGVGREGSPSFLVAPVALSDPRTLVVTSSRRAEGPLALVDLMRTRPRRLDLLIRLGSSRPLPVVLNLAPRASDDLAFDAFSAACVRESRGAPGAGKRPDSRR